jgi:hypothetical protein
MVFTYYAAADAGRHGAAGGERMTRNSRSRRAVLGAVVAGLALAGPAGCRWLGGNGEASSTPSPLAPMLAGTLALIDRYTATIAARPTLADQLNPLLNDHRAHVTALRAAMGGAASAGPAPGTPSPTAGPDDPAGALAAVRAAEQAARDAAVSDCLAAAPRYASLLGSIAACRACHLEVLS